MLTNARQSEVIDSELSMSFTITALYNDEFPIKNIAKKLVIVITPNPPTWIRSNSITCPVKVNVECMSTVVNPVTHTALADTNKESIYGIVLYVELGNRRRKDPITIMARKLLANIKEGFVLLPSIDVMALDIITTDIINNNNVLYMLPLSKLLVGVNVLDMDVNNMIPKKTYWEIFVVVFMFFSENRMYISDEKNKMVISVLNALYIISFW